MYTDESRVITDHGRGNTAAACVCLRTKPRVNKLKFPDNVSNYGTEMCAIMRSIEW